MLSREMKNLLLTLSSLCVLSSAHSQAAEFINIDYKQVIKNQNGPYIGENMNYLLSSDKHMPRKVSMKDRAKEMKLSFLRFPYGRLGDNYLFTDAPYNDGETGLTPRVASLGAPPGSLYWAVDDNGYFKNSLDFDEFISYTDKTGAEPLVMVNMLSYDTSHYPDTVVTFDDLITHAVEWVKYANITRGYNVKYWQLGNEVKSHTDKEAYFANFVTMAKALKSVDPSIQIGFGEDGRANWVKDALADPIVSAHIDFISPHQYLHNTTWTESYEDWRDHTGTVIPKIDKLQGYADASTNHKDVPMIVTEYGINGGSFAEEDPTGRRFFQLTSDNSYIGLAQDKLTLTKLSTVTNENQMIDIEMFDDTWFGLKLKNSNTGYIKSQSSATAPLTVGGIATEEGSKWRLRERKKKYYLESKQHLGNYLTFDEATNNFILGTDKKWLAEQFNLLWKYQVLARPNMWLPRDTPRMLQSISSKKFVGMQADNSLSADKFRSESTAYQFIIKNADASYGENAVTIHPQDSQAGFIEHCLTMVNKTGNTTCISSNANNNQQTTTSTTTRNTSDEISDHGIWVFAPSGNYFQLEAYNNRGNFLKVNSDGTLSADGLAGDTNTRFTHQNLPEPNPLPPTTTPEGNFGNDLWKSLIFADMTLSASIHKNIRHLIHWNTHTSFEGRYGGYHNISNSLENTEENTLTPVGQVLKIINSNTLSSILNVPAKHGKVRSYASFDAHTGEMAIILLNKNNLVEDISLTLNGYQPTTKYARWVYQGSNAEDEYPSYAQDDNGSQGNVTINGNVIDTQLEPMSLTVIRLSNPSVASIPDGENIVLTSRHSGQLVRLNNSKNDPIETSNLLHANQGNSYTNLASIFQVTSSTEGFVKLATYGGSSTDLLQYQPAAQAAIQAATDNGNFSLWQWQLNSDGHLLLGARNYPGKFMRTSAKNDYKIDRDGSKGTWSQYVWQKAPKVPLGKEIWIRSATNNELLYVDEANNLRADANLPADANAHFFTLERLSGDFVALKSSLTGQYLKSGNGASWSVKADGDNSTILDTATLFKVKLKDDVVLFESANFADSHLKVKILGDQSLDTSGGESTWAQFYWGAR
ncbi:hypothetical protein [Aliiglaciecola sp. NS0011-25]|uniref:hypothetical protein n=1 Tax=Aliiglaciecola sp. NS0011-25 TaxID=3127654 RepID=UPI003103A5E3